MPLPNESLSVARSSADAEVTVIVGAPSEEKDNRTPLWTWPVLVVAIMSVCSAASAFKMAEDVPPVILACWRLQLTGLLLLPGAVIQYWQLSAGCRNEAEDFRQRRHGAARGRSAMALRRRACESGLLMLLSGMALAVHFSLWVEGIENTTITHALFFISVTPIIIAAGMWAFGLPISTGEIAGTCLGFIGGILLAAGGAQEGEVTIFGDLSCVVASVCIILYLFIGRRLRAWMPAFVYAHVVTASAAGMLIIAALIGGASPQAAGNAGIAGWLQSPHRSVVLYLSVVPGILGHLGFNIVLKYVHPLLLTLSLAIEPLLGSLIGWSVGLADAPGIFTWIGGGVLLISTVLVVVAGHRREQADRAQT